MSLTRERIIHNAALAIIAIEEQAKKDYEAANGNWEDDDASTKLDELVNDGEY